MDRSEEQTLFQIWQELYSGIMANLEARGESVDDFLEIVSRIPDQILSLEQNQRDSSQGALLIERLAQLKEFLRVNQHTGTLHALANFNAAVQQKLQETTAATATSSTALSVPMSQGYHSLFDVPVEVITTRVMSYLRRSDIESLVRTCKTFFHSNPQRQVIRDSVIERKVFTGLGHSFVITEWGDVFAFGANAHGELGLGHRNSVRTIKQVQLPEGKKIQDIAVATKASLFLFTDGSLYICGQPAWLGMVNSPAVMTEYFSDLLQGKSVKAIAAYEDAVLVLCADNTLFVGGYGNSQLQQIIAPQGEIIKSLAIGANYMMVLCRSGRVYAMGSYHFARLQIGYASPAVEDRFKPVILPEEIQITAIAVGSSHSMLLAANNTLYTFGANDCGQRGVTNTLDEADLYAKASSVPLHDGKQPKAIMTAGNSNFVIYTDGTLCVFGDCRSTLGQDHTNVVSPTVVPLGETVRVHDLAAGGSHVLFSDTKGVIRGSGLNQNLCSIAVTTGGWLDKPTVIALPGDKPADLADAAPSKPALPKPAPPKSDNCSVM